MPAPLSVPPLWPRSRRLRCPGTPPVLRLGLVALLLAGLGGCGGAWRDTYFQKGVDRLTQDEVREKLGPPHTAKTPVLGGESLWTYRFALSERDLERWSPTFLADASRAAGALLGRGAEAPKPTLYCYRYTLTFNEEKVLTRWKRDECVPGTREQLTAR
jgi:hypothetical protein